MSEKEENEEFFCEPQTCLVLFVHSTATSLQTIREFAYEFVCVAVCFNRQHDEMKNKNQTDHQRTCTGTEYYSSKKKSHHNRMRVRQHSVVLSREQQLNYTLGCWPPAESRNSMVFFFHHSLAIRTILVRVHVNRTACNEQSRDSRNNNKTYSRK